MEADAPPLWSLMVLASGCSRDDMLESDNGDVERPRARPCHGPLELAWVSADELRAPGKTRRRVQPARNRDDDSQSWRQSRAQRCVRAGGCDVAARKRQAGALEIYPDPMGGLATIRSRRVRLPIMAVSAVRLLSLWEPP